MAELASARADRGQLLLVFAIGLAVAFVTLALILNAAVASELHSSTTNHGPAAERAVTTYQQDVWSGIGGLISSANAQDVDEIDPLRDAVANGTEDWNGLSQRQYAADGVLASVGLVDTTTGTRIVQDNQSRAATNRTGAVEWAVVDEPARVRGFRMNVTQDALATEGSACEDCFTVTIDANATNWSVYVYESGDDIVIAEGATEDTCRVANGSARIDFDNGSVNDRHCSALAFPSTVSDPHRITFANADRVHARYELFIDDDVPFEPHFAEDGAPTLEPAIYSATVTVSYRSTDLRYETELEVVPGGTG